MAILCVIGDKMCVYVKQFISIRHPMRVLAFQNVVLLSLILVPGTGAPPCQPRLGIVEPFPVRYPRLGLSRTDCHPRSSPWTTVAPSAPIGVSDWLGRGGSKPGRVTGGLPIGCLTSVILWGNKENRHRFWRGRFAQWTMNSNLNVVLNLRRRRPDCVPGSGRRWVRDLWTSGREPLVQVLDPTHQRGEWVALVVGLAYSEHAHQLAWHVVKADVQESWIGHFHRLMGQLAPAVPTGMPVHILCNRCLDSRDLWVGITELGWHPVLRIPPTSPSAQPVAVRARSSCCTPGITRTPGSC